MLFLALIFAGIIIIPIIFLVITSLLVKRFSSKVRTQVELQNILKEEQERLGLLDAKIEIRREQFTAECTKVGTNHYLITLPFELKRSSIAHELFHAYDIFQARSAIVIKCKNFLWLLLFVVLYRIKYLYWWEPRAIFYSWRRLFELKDWRNARKQKLDKSAAWKEFLDRIDDNLNKPSIKFPATRS